MHPITKQVHSVSSPMYNSSPSSCNIGVIFFFVWFPYLHSTLHKNLPTFLNSVIQDYTYVMADKLTRAGRIRGMVIDIGKLKFSERQT